jgi:hypothetical protein
MTQGLGSSRTRFPAGECLAGLRAAITHGIVTVVSIDRKAGRTRSSMTNFDIRRIRIAGRTPRA